MASIPRWLGLFVLALCLGAPVTEATAQEPAEPVDVAPEVPIEPSSVVASAPPILYETYLRSYTWIGYSRGISRRDVSAIAIDPADPQVAYQGGRGAVYGTVDGGATWVELLTVQGTGSEERQVRREGAAKGDGLEAETLRDDLVEAAIELRFEELREERLAELEADTGDPDYAQQIIELIEDDLRDDARTDVLTNQLDEIDEQVADEQGIDAQTINGSGSARRQVSGRAGNAIFEIVVDPNRPTDVFAVTGSGVFRSHNRGKDWDRILEGRGGESAITISLAVTATAIVVGTTQGLYVSEDHGNSWANYAGELGSESFVHATASGRRVFALSEHAVFRSDDGGLTWSRFLFGPGLSERNVTSVSVSPHNPDKVAIGTDGGVYISEDAGNTVTQLSSIGLANLDIFHVAFHPTIKDLLVATTGGGVFASHDLQSWQPLHEGLAAIPVRRVAFSEHAPWAMAVATPFGAFQYVPREELVNRNEALKALEVQWRHEPTLDQLMDAAKTYYQCEDGKLEGLSTRERVAWLLPTARLKITNDRHRFEDDQITLVRPTNALSRKRALRTLPTGVKWEAYALWDIGGLIFAHREMRVSKTVRKIEAERRQTLSRLVKLHARRRTLQVRAALRKDSPSVRDAIAEVLEIQKASADIDALTGSFFSKYIEGNRE